MPVSIAITHIALMTSKLKAALPTIVLGPSSSVESEPKIDTAPNVASMISGAEEPSAMRERLATTRFHTGSPLSLTVPMMTSIPSMNLLATADIPMKR